ncbi:hypothetical protein M3Y97_00178000 [Aphelenchoides bicaudatus]|nr:hypothetical protein M3Y97_00178000 [Aphelenchoides bicaudatus]
MNAFCLAIQFALLTLVVKSTLENECYHAWNQRSSNNECKSDADCTITPGANCIFSLTTNSRICCAPKAGAVLPACPPGKSLPPLGSSSGIVCAGLDDVDQCPEPYKCTESVTQFDKLPGQNNFCLLLLNNC